MTGDKIKKILKVCGILIVLIIIFIFGYIILNVFWMLGYPEHLFHEAYIFAETDPDRAMFACGEISGLLYSGAKDRCYEEIAGISLKSNRTYLSENTCNKIRSADKRNLCLVRTKIKHDNLNDVKKLCENIVSGEDNGWCLTFIAVKIAEENISDAVIVCSEIKDEWRKDWCYRDVASIAAENNTDYAIEICRKATFKNMLDDAKKDCYQKILIEISDNDPVKALDLCKELLEDGECYLSKVKLVGAYPDKAQELCGSMHPLDDKNSCYLCAAETLANEDLKKALEICNKFVSHGERNYCIGMIGRSLNVNQSDLKNSDILSDILAASDACGDDKEYECYGAFVPLIAKFDLERAISICEGLNPDPYKKAFCYGDIASVVMETDYKHAKDICDKIKPYGASFNDFCYRDMAFYLINESYENLNISLEICSEIESDYSKEQCYSRTAIQIIDTYPYEAVKICTSIPTQTTSGKEDCLHKVAFTISSEDPDFAMNTCDKIDNLPLDTSKRDWCYRDVAVRVDVSDPSKSLAVCEKINDSKIKELCIDEVKSDYRLIENN